MQPLQQPMVQCLDLSRPDSISTAGYCADVVTQASRYPQPMLYSPAKGALVTYEPPGRSGVEELQWLDSISRPKHVTAKSSKAVPRRTGSPQQQRAQLQAGTDQQQPPPQQQQQQPQLGSQPPQQQPPAGQPFPQQQSHRSGLPPEAVAAVERSTIKAERAAEQAAFTAAVKAERQLVSYPQAFSWGGRVKGKHSSLCRMNASVQSVGAGTTQPPAASDGPPAGSRQQAGCGSRAQPSPQLPAAGASMLAGQPNTTNSSSHSPKRNDVSSGGSSCSSIGAAVQGSSNNGPAGASGTAVSLGLRAKAKDLLGSDVAASAAQLGANADRLLSVLERRRKQQQQQQQQQQQHKGMGPVQHQQQHSRQGTRGALMAAAGRGADLEPHVQDEPLCTAGHDYLRL